MLVVMLLCVFASCSKAEVDDPIVGQWYVEGGWWLEFSEDGAVYEWSQNAQGNWMQPYEVAAWKNLGDGEYSIVYNRMDRVRTILYDEREDAFAFEDDFRVYQRIPRYEWASYEG